MLFTAAGGGHGGNRNGRILGGRLSQTYRGLRFCGLQRTYAGGAGLAGLNELDVVGIHFGSSTAYLCEVTTHIRGLLYRNNKETVERLKRKNVHQREYAQAHLSQFENHEFMFWSPYVPVEYITRQLEKIDGLSLVINGAYKRCVAELQEKAGKEHQDTGNPGFRVFQILGALRDGDSEAGAPDCRPPKPAGTD